MKRYGSILKIKAGKITEYKKLHAAVWPEVLKTISECNIQNYSIFLKDDFLFSYFEYHGTDYDADMAKMAADPSTKRWWDINMPLQSPVETAKEGEWWSGMEEVFHHD